MKLLIIAIIVFLNSCSSPSPKNRKITAIPPIVKIVNQAQVDAATLSYIEDRIHYWTPKVYAYTNANPKPVTIIISNKVGVGYYYRGTIYLPASFRLQSIIETYIHELAHHTTGHNSTMFFKEGIATATLEVLLQKENTMPDTWPQYGQSNDNWIRLFIEKREMLPLEEFAKWPRYKSGGENGFRSWQVYVVGGSFIRWYVDTYGFDAFYQGFQRKKFLQPIATLEKKWLAFIQKKPLISFKPKDYLPTSSRYDYFLDRLK